MKRTQVLSDTEHKSINKVSSLGKDDKKWTSFLVRKRINREADLILSNFLLNSFSLLQIWIGIRQWVWMKLYVNVKKFHWPNLQNLVSGSQACHHLNSPGIPIFAHIFISLFISLNDIIHSRFFLLFPLTLPSHFRNTPQTCRSLSRNLT